MAAQILKRIYDLERRVVDLYNKIKKFVDSGGGSQDLDQTLAIGNTSDKSIILNSTSSITIGGKDIKVSSDNYDSYGTITPNGVGAVDVNIGATEITAASISHVNSLGNSLTKFEFDHSVVGDFTQTVQPKNGIVALTNDISLQKAMDNGSFWYSDPGGLGEHVSYLYVNSDNAGFGKGEIQIRADDVDLGAGNYAAGPQGVFMNGSDVVGGSSTVISFESTPGVDRSYSNDTTKPPGGYTFATTDDIAVKSNINNTEIGWQATGTGSRLDINASVVKLDYDGKLQVYAGVNEIGMRAQADDLNEIGIVGYIPSGGAPRQIYYRFPTVGVATGIYDIATTVDINLQKTLEGGKTWTNGTSTLSIDDASPQGFAFESPYIKLVATEFSGVIQTGTSLKQTKMILQPPSVNGLLTFAYPDNPIGNYTVATEEFVNSKYNEAGQVKVNYTGLSVTNFLADTLKTFDINAATPTVVGSPTTTFPNSTPNTYAGMFDAARGVTPTGRLIENPITGQAHTWRFQVRYSNKVAGSNGSLDLILTNPVSGFEYGMAFTLPSGRTSGVFNNVAITIADNASIPSPEGYILKTHTSFTDANLTVEILSITRLSWAIED